MSQWMSMPVSDKMLNGDELASEPVCEQVREWSSM